MCVFGTAACFFGGVTIVKMNLGTNNFFNSDVCEAQMVNYVHQLWNEAVYSADSLETLLDNLVENYDYSLRKYDDKTDSYKQLDDFPSDRSYYGKIIEYGINEDKNSLWRINDDALEKEAYTLEIGLKWNLVDDGSSLYRQFSFSKFAQKYGTNSLLICAASAGLVLLLLIYEIVSAGHVKGKDGIHLSWFDKIPFDILTVGWMAFVAATISIFYENFYNSWYFSEFSIGEIVSLLIANVIFVSLLIYIYLISFVKRIKAHTIFRNIAVFILLRKAYEKVYCWLKEIKRVFHFSSVWWKRISILLLGCLFVHTCLTINLMNIVGTGGFEKLLIFILVCGEVTGSYLLLKINADTKPLLNAAENFANGNLEYRITEEELARLHGPFYKHGKNLNLIGEGMKKAIQNELKSERMKAELITNVSHDIKTPLTSIVNYVDLLSKEHTEEEEKQYLSVLQRQSQRLKRLTEDVVEVSKASSGAIDVHIEDVCVKEILEQSLAEYQDKLEEHHLIVVTNYYNENIFAKADGRLLWRVLRNVFSNVAKYAMDGSRVYVEARINGNNEVVITVKNISRDQLNINEEELMQRFVRGDDSRHTEGSGLGLSIAQSLMELMQGEFRVSIDGDLFKAEVILKEVK